MQRIITLSALVALLFGSSFLVPAHAAGAKNTKAQSCAKCRTKAGHTKTAKQVASCCTNGKCCSECPNCCKTGSCNTGKCPKGCCNTAACQPGAACCK